MTAAISLRSNAGRLRAINRELRPPDQATRALQDRVQIVGTLAVVTVERARGSLQRDLRRVVRPPARFSQHKADPEKRRRNTAIQVAFLRTLLSPATVFVEVGCDDAAITHFCLRLR